MTLNQKLIALLMILLMVVYLGYQGRAVFSAGESAVPAGELEEGSAGKSIVESGLFGE